METVRVSPGQEMHLVSFSPTRFNVGPPKHRAASYALKSRDEQEGPDPCPQGAVPQSAETGGGERTNRSKKVPEPACERG